MFFLHHLDSLSRFAKVGGEMISLGNIEDKISKLIDLEENNLVDFIITTGEDEKKGEKIILLISHVTESYILQLKDKILNSFDNKLMIPSNIKIVDEIPRLGSGKKDFAKAKLLV